MDSIMECQLNKDLPAIISCSYMSNYNCYEIMFKLGYFYDKELSNDQNRVYIYLPLNELLVVFRGTYSFLDYYTDIVCGIGLKCLSTRYYRSKNIINKIKIKYNKQNINAIGYSLGGFLCENCGATGVLLTYNKLLPIPDIGKVIDDNQYDIREKCDIVSILSYTQKGGHKECIPIKDNNPIHAHKTDDLVEFREQIIL